MKESGGEEKGCRRSECRKGILKRYEKDGNKNEEKRESRTKMIENEIKGRRLCERGWRERKGEVSVGMITRPLNVRHFLYPLYGVFRFQWTKAERWAERGRFSPFIENAIVT